MDNMQKAIIVIAIIAILVVGIVYYYFIQGGETMPSNLHVDLVTLSGRARESSTLNVSISNVGGEAKGVSVTLSSNAFSQVSSNAVDVPANQTRFAQCNAQIKDVANGEYGVTISCNYNGAGQVSTNNNSKFYVLPSIGFNTVHFVVVGFIITSEKSTIGQNDNTTLIFKIKSDSVNSTYTSLSATATMPQGTQGLTITPYSLALDNIGPQGTSNEYSFAVNTHNTPLGQYTITIHVFSAQYEIISDSSRTLTVVSS